MEFEKIIKSETQDSSTKEWNKTLKDILIDFKHAEDECEYPGEAWVSIIPIDKQSEETMLSLEEYPLFVHIFKRTATGEIMFRLNQENSSEDVRKKVISCSEVIVIKNTASKQTITYKLQ